MNKLNNIISIIIPIYNAEYFLERCINSVRKQTYKNLQILLIDDGSTDQSLEICKKFAEKDTRIEVFHTENKGSVAARKHGLKYAIGEYIGFVDADDYIELDMFEKLLLVLLENEADFVHTGYIEEIKGRKKTICDFSQTVEKINNDEDRIKFLRKYVLEGEKGNYISYSIWSKFFKSKFIKKMFINLPDEQQYGEDLLCLFRCILESKCIVLNKGTFYHYTVRDNSLSHLKCDEHFFQEIDLWYHILGVLKENDYLGVVYKDVYNFFIRRMLFSLSPDERKKYMIPKYYYKKIDNIIGKDVVIYGAGNVGQDYYAQISKYEDCRIVAWVDSNSNDCNFEYARVIDIKALKSLHFDIVIVAVWSERVGIKIIDSLINNGIPIDKIDWIEPSVYF